MPTNIYILRHGETDWNTQFLYQGRTNIPLNETGINQALIVSKNLLAQKYRFDYIYSSPLLRAFQTAKIVSETFNYPKDIIVENDLIERNFGSFEGAQINNENIKLVIDRNIQYDDDKIEKIDDLVVRAINVTTKIVNKHKNKNILIVSHSQFIKALILKVDNSFTFDMKIKNCSLFIFKDTNSNLKYIKGNISLLT